MHISPTLHALFISRIQHITHAMRPPPPLHRFWHVRYAGLTRVCKESYNQPVAVYDCCKQRGMSIVTLTDHNSIEGAEALRKHPDFFLSEEVTVSMPSGTEAHLGVYGITERDHAEIQRRRSDFVALLMYLTERKLFFSVNHVFSGLTGHRDEEDFTWFASYVPGLEVRNGLMWVKQIAQRSAWPGISAKSPSPAAIPIPSPVPDSPIRKFPEPAPWKSI